MPDANQTAKPARARRLVHYRRTAQGSWSVTARQGHHAAVAALERIAPEVAAARDVAEIHEIVSTLAGIQDLDRMPDATLRDTPDNRGNRSRVVPLEPPIEPPTETGRNTSTPDLGHLDRFPAGSGSGTGGSRGPRYRPNLSIGKGGLASDEGSEPTNIGRSLGATGTISHGSDGSVVITRTEKFDSGTTVTTSVAYQGGNVIRTDWHVANPDGSSAGGDTVEQEDGGRLEYKMHTNPDGSGSESFEEYDAAGNPAKGNDLAGQPGVDGEGHDSELAEHFRAWHRGVYGPAVLEFSVPVFVNPGSPEAAEATRMPRGGMNPGESLVINPDPNSAAGPGR